MSHLWTYSPASQSALQKCLHAAAPPNPTNPWLKIFGIKNADIVGKDKTIITINDSPEVENVCPTDNKEESEVSNEFEDIFDSDIDAVTRYDIFVKIATEHPKLLLKIAQKLPVSAIEGIFQIIFDGTNKNNEFLKNIFECFLPAFIKRDYSRLCTEVLLKTYNSYPEHFKNIIKAIIKDVEVPNNFIIDFVSNLNDTKQTEFLNNYIYTELTSEEFVYNLFIIFTVYKACNKTEYIQKYIFSCLKQHSKFCCKDKNYGRLFVCFLQNEIKFKCISNDVMLEVLETHRSPFRRPCLAILKEINQ